MSSRRLTSSNCYSPGKTASERLASSLLLLGTHGAEVTGSTIVKLPMNRSDIADYLGLTKETVSRMFSMMRRDRLIRLLALDTVQILDRSAVEKLAQSDS